MVLTRAELYEDIRINHARAISELDLDGYAIGGLAVGETHEADVSHLGCCTVPDLPQDKPIYLMGVGTPAEYFRSSRQGC